MAVRRRPLIARALGWFWAAIGLVVIAGAVTLQTLGPKEPPRPVVLSPPPPVEILTPRPPPPTASPTASPSVVPLRPGRDVAGPLAAPEPALLEALPSNPQVMLPRIASDGRAPMGVYARGFDQSNRRPRIGLLFSDFGPNLADSEDAIRSLPGGITLAFSPYASHLPHLLDVARVTGHEYLVAIPMEPLGFPQNDAGDHALLTTQDGPTNAAYLSWALGRIEGYVGATGALGPLRGERFAAATGPMNTMLRTLATRGLLYVDARPDAPKLPVVFSRAVDVVIDEPAVRTEIDAKLAQLEKLAHDRGSALGLAGVIRPLTVARVVAWANALQDHGLALAPVSALVQPPGRSAPDTGSEMPSESAR